MGYHEFVEKITRRCESLVATFTLTTKNDNLMTVIVKRCYHRQSTYYLEDV